MRAIRNVVAGLGLLSLLSGCGTSNSDVAMQPATPDREPVATVAAPATSPAATPEKTAEAAAKEARQKELDRFKLQHRRAKLARELDVAERNVHKAEMALANQKAESDAAVHRAEVEQELAASKLKKLEDRDAPLRLAEVRLNVRGYEDGMKEAEEELAQLEMMYKDEDLADKTREIVLNRSRRRLERARTGLTNQQTGIENLEKYTLPLEMAELRSQLAQKVDALAAAKRTAEANLMDKDTAVISAKNEITRINEEIAEVEKEREAAEAGK